jgi:hypothetical protein
VAQREQQFQNVAFQRAKVRLSIPGKDLGNGTSFARLDQLVDVFGTLAEPLSQGAGHGGLSSRHEPDQVNLVRRHRVSRASSSKNPGYDTSTDEAPVIVVGDEARVAAMANAIASR